ncbi:MAG: cadmium-translocating P-type ATPase [Chloroflexi bacterium]|nr:MAG: cadmium-translocating P-type ATPase [Chloroflexota bacterium]
MDKSNITGQFDFSEDSPRCTEVLSDTLKGYAGIRQVDFDLEKGRLELSYDHRILSDEHAMRLVSQAGKRAWSKVRQCAMKNNAGCEDCMAALQNDLFKHYQMLAQIQSVPSTNFQSGVVSIQLDHSMETNIKAYDAEETPAAATEVDQSGSVFRRERLEIIFTVVNAVSALIAFVGSQLGLPSTTIAFLYVIAYMTGGYYGLMDGLKVVRERRLDVNLLMIFAALGAALIGQPAEGAALLFLFSLSNTLQSFAMDRSRKAIEKLLDLRPQQALVRRGSRIVSIPVEKLIVGDVVLVRPGERFPIDGEVISGTSTADQSTITGESIPLNKEPGHPVYAGTLNGNGALEIRVTRLAKDTTLAKIVSLVEEAQGSKAKTQRMLDNFEQVYAVLVMLGAVLLVIIPTFLLQEAFYPTFYRAMTWLVVASPCALVISTPASILSAIANGARRGILFKGGVYLEQAASIKVVAFDKTGTLTTGEPTLTAFLPSPGVTEEYLLRLAAAAEARSEHPLASAIVHAAQRQHIDLPQALQFQAIPGQGVEASVEGKTVWIGNERLFMERGAPLPNEIADEVHRFESDGQTVMIVKAGEDWLGILAVADTLREDAADLVAALKRQGVEHVIMLTGDNEQVAANIAARSGVDDYKAGLLPQDKVHILKNLRHKYGVTAMVGDGVNDAPALATADIGIAMGGAGTDVALETADVVLMGDNLKNLPYAIGLARKARRTVWQNLAFSMAVIILLVLTTFGAYLPLPMGVVGHEGSTVLVVLNGLRLLAYRGK